MAAISMLNPKAELARATQALGMNVTAARSIQEVMKSNLGPKGTMKMLVSGAGDIKITKDGNVLLHEMQIQHPTASLIARASTAQDDIIGDGTTSTVLLIGELLKMGETYLSEGVHPRILVDGFYAAREMALKVLDEMKITGEPSKETLIAVARTSLRTKVDHALADTLATMCVDAVECIHEKGKELDLHMVEIMEMPHRVETETQLVKGIVMDHGARHPDMPKRVTNALILTCNVSLEYEKSEVNAGFFYKSADEREKLLASEREFIDERVRKIIALKKQACQGTRKAFVVINQKGIDPTSLDMLAREGILALRRAKRRNMERLPLAVGGVAVNSVDDLTPEVLGHAGLVYEHVLKSHLTHVGNLSHTVRQGETKFTFVEECDNPRSVTLLIRGGAKYVLTQVRDAIRDGLRAVKNAIDDKGLIPGAGAFELRAHKTLMARKGEVAGRARLGVEAFAKALLVIPKVLGFDAQETLVKLEEELDSNMECVGVDLESGGALIPSQVGIYDNYCVKKHQINSA
ncbi:unnamed protein product [Darwinula stevensoni]|uniref:Chaperonin n=1 Tax=Darwinula stevensoni TaxID=69355 RepID=A0A7R8XB96_9CRUS|nr:unnamed protein product [Darwinula stevensoni]CAG0892635.1 unnamed protein product [Darwinula stevensoni]